MTKYIKLKLSLLVVLLFGSLAFTQVQAGSGGGTGGEISGGGKAPWYHSSGEPWSGSGTTAAWKSFEKNALQGSSGYNLKREINNLGKVGNFEGTLYEACQKSQFIWWYGEHFFTKIGNNAHPAISDMPHSARYGFLSRLYLNKFASIPNNGWNKRGGTVLICSWSIGENPVSKPLTLKANSGKFLYDGKSHTVSGYKTTAGKLDGGHTLVTTATGSRTQVGVSPVNFGTTKITSSGRDVTKEYDITHIRGQIEILGIPVGDDERCLTKATEAVTAVVKNKVSVDKGFLTEGAPNITGLGSKTYENGAYDLTKPASLPKGAEGGGDTKATWTAWKNKFTNAGKDLSTYKFNLESNSNAANTLSKYGGVLNVTRAHSSTKVEAVLCQPQEREVIITEDGEGEADWSEWKDVGPEKIKSIKVNNGKGINNHVKEDLYSYQILGVNCNLDGFNKVKSDYATQDLTMDGGGSGSGLLATKESSGTGFPLGKPNHYTGKNVFYKPDGKTWNNSCKDTFKGACISTKFEVASENNAHENLGNEHLFTEIGEDGGLPSENGEVNFFRDNIDREVRADVWYVKGTGKDDLVTSPGDAAKRTTAKIFGGTPEIEVTTIAPWGTEDKFTEANSNKEWNSHVNRFNIKSQWASDEGKPYELGVDWAYGAEAKNVGPNEVDGYRVLNTTGIKSYPFEAHCTFRNESGSYDANVSDNPFIDGGKLEPIWDNAGKIKTLFTRSVSDKNSN